MSYTASGVCSVRGSLVRLTGRVGNVHVTATQPGDATYAPAPSVTRRFKVVPANHAPTARPDSASTVQGRAVTVRVLANDSDRDADRLRILSVGRAKHGAVHAAGRTVVYRPAAGFVGRDRFTYTVGDGRGGRSRRRHGDGHPAPLTPLPAVTEAPIRPT